MRAERKKKPMEKKKLIVWIAVALIFAAGLTTIFLTVIFPRQLKTPSPSLLPVRENAFYIQITWEPVPRAIGYKAEYRYGDTGSYEAYEFTATTVTLPRQKGTLRFRVQALSKYLAYDGAYTDWQEYLIPGIPLTAPDAPTFVRNSETTAGGALRYYYQVEEGSWEPITYQYPGANKQLETKTVIFYEIAVVAPGGDVEDARSLALKRDEEEFRECRFYLNSPGRWQIQIRALNYKGEYGEYGSIAGEPVELRDVFEVSEWTVATVDVV